MFLSRASQARSLRVGLTENKEEEKKKPKLEDFLSARDYTGAITLLNFQLQTGESEEKVLPWLGYCTFHLGDFKKALETYNRLLKSPTADPVNHLYAACCMFYLGMLNEAVEAANKGPKTRLYYRIMCHVAWKRNDEPTLLAMHERLEDSVGDQLCMAAIYYLRGNFQDAIDIYKRLLQQDKSRIALQVLIALCYYKLEYFEVSLELLPPYLEMYADSAIAVNLKACNTFKLFDGKAAEGELKGLMDIVQSSSHTFENDLVRHNLVVFRNGENALQVLPPLVDIIPEARLNLAVFHLRRGEVKEAHELMEALKPVTPPDYILKGVVNAALGQQIDSADHIKAAMTFYQLVGASASEMDTIPGRLCMASCFFLMKQFDDVLIYLNSVKAYCVNDPVFNYNYGIALAMCRQYREAEEALLNVTSEKFRSEYMYLSWLARCYIMNGKASEAWNLYLKLDNSDSFSFLILIANDCYRVGAFYYAAKAFDVLERLDPSPEYWEGKRGACCGVFQMVLAGKARREQLRDIIAMLRGPNTNPQSDLLARVMAKWAADNHYNV